MPREWQSAGAIQGSDEGKNFCDQVSPVSGSVEMLNGPTIPVPFQKHLLSEIYQEIQYIYNIKMLALDNEYLLASLFPCIYIYIMRVYCYDSNTTFSHVSIPSDHSWKVRLKRGGSP